jgi:hypothetical protein
MKYLAKKSNFLVFKIEIFAESIFILYIKSSLLNPKHVRGNPIVFKECDSMSLYRKELRKKFRLKGFIKI